MNKSMLFSALLALGFMGACSTAYAQRTTYRTYDNSGRPTGTVVQQHSETDWGNGRTTSTDTYRSYDVNGKPTGTARR